MNVDDDLVLWVLAPHAHKLQEMYLYPGDLVSPEGLRDYLITAAHRYSTLRKVKFGYTSAVGQQVLHDIAIPNLIVLDDITLHRCPNVTLQVAEEFLDDMRRVGKITNAIDLRLSADKGTTPSEYVDGAKSKLFLQKLDSISKESILTVAAQYDAFYKLPRAEPLRTRHIGEKAEK